ncbi:hypothetical protein ACHAPT_004284 [Fusarium lateritium]
MVNGLGDLPAGTLLNSTDIKGLPGLEWATRHHLSIKKYTFFRSGAAREWSYRKNLESCQHYRFRPRTMVGIAETGLSKNVTAAKEAFARSEKAGAKALVYTADWAADGAIGSGSLRRWIGLSRGEPVMWNYYKKMTTWTSLGIVTKGTSIVEYTKPAIKHSITSIVLSNHGARQLDGAPSALETATKICEEDPALFDQNETYADGRVLQSADVLKLPVFGVKTAGFGRPFMFANVYGIEGVKRAIDLLKLEVSISGGNRGLPDVSKINSGYVKWTPNNRFS